MLNVTKPLVQNQIMTCIDPNGVTIEFKSYQQWPYVILMKHNRGHWVVYKAGDSDFITPIWNKKITSSQADKYAIRSFLNKEGN